MTDANVNTGNKALVVIDLQKAIVSRPCMPYDSQTVVSNAKLLADAFRGKDMPVFLVHVVRSADGKDALHPPSDNSGWSSPMTPDGTDFVSELGQVPSDFVISKRQWGAFYGTELDLQLRRRSIDTIVLCGISTDIGVESTARNAYELGYGQIFAEDAMSAMSKEEHDHTVQKIFPRIGRVLKTQDIVNLL